ncbi:membrane protein [Streptomyces mashuensis]|uniref:Membrane protein n=1 Tax=Streptomyces mashuensis TaxID=33904 RepID=A0A919EDA9_9ACTN|nr:PspC domain-containing protein [Streptomyces mashuensis]GHF47605.1 membrane protein [Streptomyces mashuensis]
MTGAPTAETPTRPTLRRSREHKMLAGVCGGLGRCFDMDPVVFRVVLGVLAATGGLGLIAYGLAWLLVPLEDEEENEARRMLSGRVEGPALTAVLCALVGCGLFLSMLNNSGAMAFSLLLLLTISGAAYWSQYRRRPEAETEEELPPPSDRLAWMFRPHKTLDAPPETQAPPAPGSPSWWRDPVGDAGPAGRKGVAMFSPGYLWGPEGIPFSYVPDPAHAPAAAAAMAKRPVPRPAPVVREDGPQLGGASFFLALAACGLGTGLTWNQQPVGTSLEIGLACALGVFGLGLAVSSRYGRTGGGTVVAAALTGVLLVGAAALPASVTAEWSRTTWRPATPAQAAVPYRLGSGEGRLDLTGVSWQAGAAPVAVHAEVGAGRLTVVVPQDVSAQVDIRVGVGDVQLPGEARDEIDVAPARHRRVTLAPAAGQTPRGTLELSLKAGIGQVEVVRATP